MKLSGIILAVLPFQFSDLRTGTIIRNFEEDLVYHFSKFQGISVLSYYSTSRLSLGDEDLLQKYNVSHIVTGSFRHRDDKVIINIQLIEFPDNRIVYDQRVEYLEEEIFDVLDQVILQVTNLLQDKINRAILSNAYQKPEVELEVYELFLMGNAHLQYGTPEDDHKARTYFERAISKQPNFARAYSGISSSYFNEWSCQMWERWEISQQGAKKFALKAIELDEKDYISLSILGRVLLFERDFEQAEHYLRKSIELNQNDASTLLQIAFSFMFLGHIEEAIELYERACQLDPLREDRYMSVGATLFFENAEFDKALKMGKQLESKQTYIDFEVYMAAASYYLGDEKKAIVYWRQYLEKFQNHIYFDGKSDSQDAFSWHVTNNPYKNRTQLTEFRSYIKDYARFELVSQAAEKSERIQGSLIFGDRQVEIKFGGKTSSVSKTKGLIDIASLLIRPQEDIHCMDLMGGFREKSNSIEVIDERSRRAYQERIKTLQTDIREAEDMNDVSRANKLNTEYEQLVDHLSRSLGIDGKSRKATSSADKARSAVTLRIRDAIKKVAKKNEALGVHLRNSIKTGMLCAYRPEHDIDWQIEGLD